MKTFLRNLGIGLTLFFGVIYLAQAATAGIPITVPSATSTGYMLVSKENGRYEATSTNAIIFGNATTTGTDMILTANSAGQIVSSSTPVMASFFATSTTATSTIAGNLWVKGNAQVDGKLFAPITFTTANLVVTGAGDSSFAGDLGIGTAGPDKALEINSATGANLRLTYNDSNGSAVNYTDFGLSSTGRLTLTPSTMINGDYGLSVAIPNTTGSIFGLQTIGNSTVQLASYIQQNGNGMAAFYANVLGTGDAASLYNINGGQGWAVGLDNSDSDKFKISGSQSLGISDYLTILTTGNVGIGTTSPYAKLSVEGSSALGNSALAGYFIATTSTASVFPYASTTALTATTASTTNLIVSALNSANCDLKADTNGVITCGTDATGGGGGGTGWASTTDAFSIYFTGRDFVGIGTTSPYAKLSVVGETVAEKFTATSTTATSTFLGGVIFGNNGLVYQQTTATTTISNLNMGTMSFDNDAGVVQLVDFPVVSAANGTTQSFSAGFNSNASTSINIFGKSNGSGNVTNFGFMVATSTQFDTRDVLTIGGTLSGNATTTITLESKCYNVRNAAGTWISFYFIGTSQIIENNVCR